MFIRLSQLFILLICLYCTLQAQEYSEEQILKGKSIYISNDKVEINIYGKNNQSQSYRAFQITRDVTYHIVNGYGMNVFDKFKLPHDFDPTNLPHASAVKNLGTYYSAYKIEDFKAIVKRKGKKPFKPKVRKKIKYKESFNLDYLYDYSQQVYQFEDLMIGDEIRIQYTILIPFEENYSRFASYRIFFNDSIPKLKYELTIKHNDELDIELFTFNGAEPSKEYTTEKTRYRQWRYENLPGCVAEPGSRAFEELPYLTWVINYYKYYVHNDNELQTIPHYAVISYIKEKDLADILTSIQIGSKSRQFAPFTKKYEEITKDLPNDHNIISEIHEKITERFKYQNDIEYYRRNDLSKEQLGESFENEVLRDASRYNLYYAIMIKSGLQSYSAYLIDKRFGEVSEHYFQPNFDSDYLLALFFGENLVDFILPKRDRYGWYYNELPFYFENTTSRLVHISDYSRYRGQIKEVFRSATTPLTPAEANTRNHHFRVSIDPEADSIEFNGELNMTGQFSTMCRLPYLGSFKDPTVHKNYNRTLWQAIPDSRLVNRGTDHVSSDFPHEANFERGFKSAWKIKKADDGEISVDLSNWFPHATPPPMAGQERYLKFYADFAGKDVFEYELQFLRPVELKEEVTFGFENEFGYYKFTVLQKEPMSITVKSELEIRLNEIPASNYDSAREIFQAIKKANQYKVVVK